MAKVTFWASVHSITRKIFSHSRSHASASSRESGLYYYCWED